MPPVLVPGQIFFAAFRSGLCVNPFLPPLAPRIAAMRAFGSNAHPRGNDHERRIRSHFALCQGDPYPSPRFGGFPKYNFVGGHNDPSRIPIEGLIEATASVLRREGSKLAMYNLGQGPQGFIGLREFVADKLNHHRGMNIGRDEVLITTGSGQGIEMISRMFVEPGDTGRREEFCYAGVIDPFSVLAPASSAFRSTMAGSGWTRSPQCWRAEAQRRHAEIHLHHPYDSESDRQHHEAGAPATTACRRGGSTACRSSRMNATPT